PPARQGRRRHRRQREHARRRRGRRLAPLGRPVALPPPAGDVAPARAAAAAADPSPASDALSRSATDQATSLDLASSTMADISTTTRTNAKHAHDAEALVTDADQMIQGSNVALGAMVESMASIQDASTRVTR